MTSTETITAQIADHDLHSVRVVFADQHGLMKGKTVAASRFDSVLEAGIAVPGSLLHKDTGNNYAIDLWSPTGDPTLDSLIGARNMLVVPDPTTFHVLPWAPRTAWILGDVFTLDHEPILHSTRQICRRAVESLAGHGYSFIGGLELEFHLYRVGEDGALSHTHPGWDLLGEACMDEVAPAIEPIRAGLVALGFPPATIEAELGPSQIELTFAPAVGLEVADQALLIRTAIRNIARANGLKATFMSRPKMEDRSFHSGWHLHQSLADANDASLASKFMPESDEPTSELGRHYVAGLLEHADASCLLTTPTVTGYKRYKRHAVTPNRVSWSREHRGSMLRIVGGTGDPASRVENRAGDSAANPYLYVASQILSGLDGIERSLIPPAIAADPYAADAGQLLPKTLGEAIEAFRTSEFYRRVLGEDVTSYLVKLKQSEWDRFCAEVTDWEQKEYFELY